MYSDMEHVITRIASHKFVKKSGWDPELLYRLARMLEYLVDSGSAKKRTVKKLKLGRKSLSVKHFTE